MDLFLKLLLFPFVEVPLSLDQYKFCNANEQEADGDGDDLYKIPLGVQLLAFTHDEFRSASDDKAQKDKAHNPSVEAIGRVPVKHRVCLTRVYHEVHVRIGRA